VVLTQPLDTGVLDSMYGNLGQSLVTGFKSYTIDFSHMQGCGSFRFSYCYEI
jgi:hypothetical protein